MGRLHGGGYRFVDDLGKQRANGTLRKEIILREYALSGREKARALVVSRTDAGCLTANFILSESKDEPGEDLTGSAGQPPELGAVQPALTDVGAIADQIQLYTRIVNPSGSEATAPASLDAIAAAMTSSGGGSGGSGIPAAYTYFGQFLAHDMSFMQWDALAGAWTNRRGHALNLDSLFQPVAGCGLPSSMYRCAGGVCLGQTTSPGQDHRDLPRDVSGAPCVPDPRSDNNLGVAQMHVAIARFHHAVVGAFPGLSESDQKRITRRHLQAIVLFDFLEKFIHPDVYRSVMKDGRRVIAPGQITTGIFLLPIEFAVACYRFGHSLVRDIYDPWFIEARQLESLLYYAHNTEGGFDGLVNGRLPLTWIQDWRSLAAPDPVTGVSPVETAPIDLRIASKLGSLDDRYFFTKPGEGLSTPVNLALQTLRRGYALGLPSAQVLEQNVSAALGETPGTNLLSASEIVATSNPVLSALADSAGFRTATPLWFYTLREAEVIAATGGRGLGPLASRVIMETMHAAIETADDSIIANYVGGKPVYDFQRQMAVENAPVNKFMLADLIKIARFG